MFKSARINLTAWYLVIIMAISLSFSAVFFRGVTLEFQRRLNTIESRFNQERPLGWRMMGPVHEYFIDDLREAKARVLLILLYTNAVIFVLSGVAGYFLAGRTLAPIEQAMDEQKRFVADASHELKTPLTALQTSIEVALRDKKLSLKDAKSALKGSLEDIENLKKLSNDLLSLTSFQQNGHKLPMNKVDVEDAVSSAYKKIEPLAKEKNITLNLETTNLKLKANFESLEKLITILLDNAVKYTPNGGKVSLSVYKGQRNAVIKVKDTGVGIAKHDIPHIFDRFFRADASRTKGKVDGYGLGLSIAKSIAQLHNGEIKVDSSPNKGSTFIVKLPHT